MSDFRARRGGWLQGHERVSAAVIYGLRHETDADADADDDAYIDGLTTGRQKLVTRDHHHLKETIDRTKWFE
ncbi:uncharacterized protein RAG0_05066 [Rhynchosporium agropyri]|uniref:Uncharacterized protein n=1 Tax=Rhynchosporium agropyri TaxID=914238 RepID=A0A1E1KBV2_9HELO|nr:uncharacterized protein RAG0_05066 [Rhynchosporium agropyri]